MKPMKSRPLPNIDSCNLNHDEIESERVGIKVCACERFIFTDYLIRSHGFVCFIANILLFIRSIGTGGSV